MKGNSVKRKKVLAISIALGLVWSGGAATAAFADASQSYFLSGSERVNVSFKSSNNELRVYDAASDGYGGRSYWRTSSGSTGTADNSNGYNTSTVHGIPGSTGTIYFKACAKNGGVDVGCRTTDASSAL